MIAYLDSSVVLRIVLGQRDRLREWPELDAGVASGLVEVECLRTLDRTRLAEGLGEGAVTARREAVYRLLAEVNVVDPDRAVLARASLPLPVPLGTLDAIHLATALVWREREATGLVMATHDAALALAARACGFPVLGSLDAKP